MRGTVLICIIPQIAPGQDFSDLLGPPIERGSWKKQNNSSEANREFKLHKFTTASQTRQSGSTSDNEEAYFVDKDSLNIDTLHAYPLAQDEFADAQQMHMSMSTHLLEAARPLSRRDAQIARPCSQHASHQGSVDPDDSDSGAEGSIYDSGAVRRPRLSVPSPSAANGGSGAFPESPIRYHGRSSTQSLLNMVKGYRSMALNESPPSGPEQSNQILDDTLKQPQQSTSSRRNDAWAMPSVSLASIPTRWVSPILRIVLVFSRCAH